MKKIPPDAPRKMIGGFEHVQIPCDWCKEMVWTQPEKLIHGEFCCNTCWKSNLHPTTGGGTRVFRKGEMFS